MRLHSVAVGFVLLGCGDNAKDVTPDAMPDAPVDSPATAHCVPPSILAALDDFVEQLNDSASMLATHPGPLEAAGFFRFPALELALPSQTAPLFLANCTEGMPMQFDEACATDGICTRLECTGAGQGWKWHFYVKASAGTDPSYSVATIDTAWKEGDDGMTFDIAATASGTNNWTLGGTGAMGPTELSVEITFPSLVAEGPLVLTATGTADDTHGGQITIAGDVAATADPASGAYMPIAACQ